MSLDPRNIGGLVGWVRGGGDLWTLNGGTVSAVTDVAPSAATFAQATAGLQPTALTAWRNGLSAYDIDGTKSLVSAANWTTLQPLAGYTRFCVFSADTFTGPGAQIYSEPGLICDSTTGNCGSVITKSGGGTKRVRSWNYDGTGGAIVVNSTLVESTPYVHTTWSDPADRLYTKLNHAADVGSAAYTPAVQAGGGVCRLGASYLSLFWMDGQIAEVLFYNRILVAAERAAVQSYLHSRWGI